MYLKPRRQSKNLSAVKAFSLAYLNGSQLSCKSHRKINLLELWYLLTSPGTRLLQIDNILSFHRSMLIEATNACFITLTNSEPRVSVMSSIYTDSAIGKFFQSCATSKACPYPKWHLPILLIWLLALCACLVLLREVLHFKMGYFKSIDRPRVLKHSLSVIEILLRRHNFSPWHSLGKLCIFKTTGRPPSLTRAIREINFLFKELWIIICCA